MLWVVQISAHSACTASRPRSRNCRNPRPCLICPNTGSTICFLDSRGGANVRRQPRDVVSVAQGREDCDRQDRLAPSGSRSHDRNAFGGRREVTTKTTTNNAAAPRANAGDRADSKTECRHIGHLQSIGKPTRRPFGLQGVLASLLAALASLRRALRSGRAYSAPARLCFRSPRAGRMRQRGRPPLSPRTTTTPGRVITSSGLSRASRPRPRPSVSLTPWSGGLHERLSRSFR